MSLFQWYLSYLSSIFSLTCHGQLDLILILDMFGIRTILFPNDMESWENLMCLCHFQTEVKRWISDVGKVLGGMKVFSCRVMGMYVKRRLYEGVAVTTALYGAETLSMGLIEKKR